MSEHTLRGVAAAPGVAHGLAFRWAVDAALDERVLHVAERPAALANARKALRQAAAELEAMAASLRREGHDQDAEVIEAGVLIAVDPLLRAAVEDAVMRDGRDAGAALRVAIDAAAAQLEALDDAMLAERAADVRSLGRRAVRLALGARTSAWPSEAATVVVAEDLGPADVTEFPDGVSAIALSAGGVTGHAAIVARSAGLPMVVGLGSALHGVREGASVIVDGDSGVLVADPSAERLAACEARTQRQRTAHAARDPRDAATRDAATRDGRRIRLLANVASPLEAERALRDGAEGIGLLRTELAFLDAHRWPSAAQQRSVLQSIFARTGGQPVTVRLFDFGGDKTPPFLRGVRGRGVELLLDHMDELAVQVKTIVEAGRGSSQLRILVPMVTAVGQLRAVRRVVEDAAEDLGSATPPAIGAMIETPEAAGMAAELAAEAAVLSIGTNDLASRYFGVERTDSSAAPTHHPEVLRLIAHTVDAARERGIPSEVCGESASDPLLMPLLVGLGVGELSVGAARIAVVRSWMESLTYDEVERTARCALEVTSPREVEELMGSVRRRLDG